MKTVIYPDKRLFPCLDLIQNNCQTATSYYLNIPKLRMGLFNLAKQ